MSTTVIRTSARMLRAAATCGELDRWFGRSDVFVAQPAERAHQRDVADHIDHLAIDQLSCRQFVMQQPTRCRKTKHGDTTCATSLSARGHRALTVTKPIATIAAQAAARSDEHVLDGIDRIRCRDAARQHAGQASANRSANDQ